MTTALRINARLDDDLASKLRDVERRTGKSATEIVRAALERYFATEASSESSLAMLEAAGFVGCVSGPGDLSTRYKELLGPSLRKKHRR